MKIHDISIKALFRPIFAPKRDIYELNHSKLEQIYQNSHAFGKKLTKNCKMGIYKGIFDFGDILLPIMSVGALFVTIYAAD